MAARSKRIQGVFALVVGATALLGIGYWMGQGNSVPLAAQQAAPKVTPVAATIAPETDAKRVVAYMYGQPITREEYGDYLISIYGAERLDLYVNKRIIETACAKKGIEVTMIEINAAIEEDCRRIKISKDDFIRTVLKQRYGKTLDEWQNDVMKPRLMLSKLCRDQIVVDEEDLKKRFINRFGEKARCKIIVWPLDQKTVAFKQYGEIRKGDSEFDAVAVQQHDPALAARAGEIEPIGRFAGPESAKVEEIAFNLKPGAISEIVSLPIGYIVVKRIGTIEADASVEFEKVKAELRKEVVDRKLDSEIPNLFAKMRDEAKPMLLLKAKTTDVAQSPKK
ncbi:MAG: peptidylprolyl isomerase [Planctomycetes bacterium]|nr:peptidylprolyl isomerase [Planctomycetota bacterium]